MEKNIEYTVKRKIQYTEIDKRFVAYRDTMNVNGEESKPVEGIAAKNEIEALTDGSAIPGSKLALCKKEILEYLRNHPFYRDFDLLYGFLIEEPYTFVTNHVLDDTVILKFDGGSHRVYYRDGKEVPQAVEFDYIKGHINDGYYDLNHVLNILKSRDDIVLKTGEIVQSPYYSDTNFHIDFTWIPTEETFSLIRDKDEFLDHRRERILKEIIGIERTKNPYVD